MPLLMQCGPGNDDTWNKAEEETELAKQEACNVKVQTQKTTETAEIAAQKKREVAAVFAFDCYSIWLPIVHERQDFQCCCGLILLFPM